MRYIGKISIIVIALVFVTLTALQFEADARVGGGRSFGSRGTRTYSAPSRSYSQPSQYAPPSTSVPYQQPRSGGFLRGLAGGIVGGMLGGMLFRSLGFAGLGGAGGGIGLFDIILIAGILYLIYRFVKSRRRESAAYQNSYYRNEYQPEKVTPISQEISYPSGSGDVAAGLSYIRQMDAAFDEQRFKDGVMDIFFRVQGGWMNRDISPVNGILTDEMRRLIQEDVDALIREKKVNRLENIAVRDVEIVEAWQESGQDYITARIYANLLDYTTNDTTGEVLSGSKTDPIKFEEYWTFSRPVGNNPWKLSAINQS